MKLLTLILLTFILFLVFKPGIERFSLQANTEQTCCSGHCAPVSDNDTPEDREHDNNGNGKSCNPLQVCSCCVWVYCNRPYDFIPKPIVFSDKRFSYHSVFTSQFISDIWQPPKIV